MRNSKIVLKVVCMFIMIGLILKIFDFLTVPAQSSERIMIHEFYRQDSIDILCIGASTYKRGIDPWILEEGLGYSAFNLSTVGQNIRVSYFFLKDIIENNYKPRLLILDIGLDRLIKDPDVNASYIAYDHYRPSWNKVEFFFNMFTYENSLKALFPSLRSYYQENVKKPGIIKENLKGKLTPEYWEYDYSFGKYAVADYVGKGFTQNYKVLRPEANFPPNMRWERSYVREKNLIYFKKCIELCKQNGIDVMLVDLPNNLLAFEIMNGYMGYHEYLGELEKEWGVEVVDFGLIRKNFFDRENKEYYRDYKHLNTLGAETVTRQVLVPYIKDYWKGIVDEKHYFYSSQDEMRDENRFVYSAYLQTSADKKVMTAKATHGTGVVPEYEFLYGERKGGDYTVIRPYGTKAEVDISGYKSGYIRVNARTLGSQEPFEHYYRKAIGSE